jgi:hypothetical protein
MPHDISSIDRDIEFMNNRSQWTAMNGHVCPLRHVSKRDPEHSDLPHLGFLIAGHGFTVYIGIMYQIGHADRLPTEEYASANEVGDAGWRVD